jgi:hypothetical protein
MRKSLLLTSAAALLAMSTSAQAVLIYDWENDAQGFSGIAGFSTTTGVTSGSYSAYGDFGSAFTWAFQIGNWNANFAALNEAQKVGTQILLDVTLEGPAMEEGQGLNVGLWVFHAAANTGIGSFQVTPGQTVTLTFNIPDGVGGPNGESDGVPRDWTQFRIWTQGGGGYDPGNIYIDNLRVVPEPASLGLMGGLAATGLMVRRRRA